jgi:hypothetical protein
MSRQGERRSTPRKPAHFAAEIEVDGKGLGCGLSRDASSTGFLLFTRVSLPPGTKVLLRLMVPGETAPRTLDAAVVRCEKLAPGESRLWSHKVGVALEKPPQDLSRIVETFTKR